MSQFPIELCNLISDYHPIYKLLDWIPVDKLDWKYLCYNKNATEIVKAEYYKTPSSDRQMWYVLSKWSMLDNSEHERMGIIREIQQRTDNDLNWVYECSNTKDINMLKTIYENNPYKLNWKAVAMNPNIFQCSIDHLTCLIW